jgi:transketolase
VSGSGNPDAIEQEIAQTREELGDTVDALARKTDVKAQAKQKVEETKTKVSAKTEPVFEKAKQASPDTASDAAARVSSTARENPAPLAAAALFAVGFLAGRITKRE